MESIQPPAQIHSVYTPVASFARGGHFYSYDMCHLTEIGRHFDFLCKGEFTNQVHHHALETLVRMLVGLPRLDPERGTFSFPCSPPLSHRSIELSTTSLIALCLMVIRPELYKMGGHVIQHIHGLVHAQEIARQILASLGHSDASDGHPYYSDARNFLEPGERFSHHSCLARWQIIT